MTGLDIAELESSAQNLISQTGRYARIVRETKETSITVEVNLDGRGVHDISSGIGFFDHMLTAFAVHGNYDLRVHAVGDIHIDGHHTIEDTAIVLGQAFNQALTNKAGINRFGDAFIPMDETLVHAVIDVSGRAYCVFEGEPDYMLHSSIQGDYRYDTVMNRHFFESFADHARINLHLRVLYGRDPHHITEAEFKAVSRALRQAVAWSGNSAIPSTKGSL